MLSIVLCSYEVISFMCVDHMMPFLTHFIGITSTVREQYGIGLPGSNIVPLDRDNGTFNSSKTDVVEKVNFLVAASLHGGTSVAEGSP